MGKKKYCSRCYREMTSTSTARICNKCKKEDEWLKKFSKGEVF